jgi:hypothetical protein
MGDVLIEGKLKLGELFLQVVKFGHIHERELMQIKLNGNQAKGLITNPGLLQQTQGSLIQALIILGIQMFHHNQIEHTIAQKLQSLIKSLMKLNLRPIVLDLFRHETHTTMLALHGLVEF